MTIQSLFRKDINREIQGVIKIGSAVKEDVQQELEEYVVTDELKKHFDTFFTAYTRAFERPTDKMGVWISGFFGSGKSHFLKILSYLLSSGMEIDGKRAVDFFEDKIEDEELLKKMRTVAEAPSEVALFNIDSKADSDSKQNKTAIVKVFNKVYNEMRGYSASIPWLAELEETLDRNGQYDQFKANFQEIVGLSWEEGRDELYYRMDEAIEALAKTTGMSEDSARSWVENGEDNYSISVDSFANRLRQYVETKEDRYRLVFAADEVGQYISGNTQLMLNLQTVAEDLGKLCKGKVWIIVTSQQDIDSLRENLSVTDFSKIQGRFNTRMNLSSANADEVIKIRLLEKTDDAYHALTLTYDEEKVALRNKLEFEEAATMRFYRDRDDFARVYPFVPYQFNLLQSVFTAIREHGSAGKHLSDGERNLLESIQQATIRYQDKKIGQLIPFQTFYESIDQALEHSVRSTIIRAQQNESLTEFDVAVLKVLFLIRYVDEMPGTLKNLTTLMLSHIEEDTIELGKRISESLQKLEREYLVQRIGKEYLFLTNEEQDVNREINRIQIPTSEVVKEAGRILFDELLNMQRYAYRPFSENKQLEYLIDFSQWIDDRNLKNPSIDFGVRFLSVYAEEYEEEPAVLALSQRESKLVVQLPSDEDFGDLRQYMQINQYLREQSAKKKTPVIQEIQYRKATERGQIYTLFKSKLQSAVEHADLYVNGYPVEVKGSFASRIDEGLRVLVESTYPKINYVERSYTKDDLEKLIYEQQEILEDYTDKNYKATEEIDRYLGTQQERNMLVTLREVMDRFGKEPYSWKDLDILASLIRLIKAEKIHFSLNNRKMSVTESDFLRQVQRKDMQESIWVTKRQVLDSRIVDSVRTIVSELYGVRSIGEKEEEIYQYVHGRLSKEQSQLERLRENYRFKPYPGKEEVETAIQLLRSLLNITDSGEFLTALANQEDDVLDVMEDLDDVKDFFETNKKEIFETTLDRLKKYKEDQNYLDNQEIDFIVEKMKDIQAMPRPYARFRELQELNQQFDLEMEQEMDRVMVPIQELMEQDAQDVYRELEALKGFPEYDQIVRSFRFKMEDLEKNVTHAPTLRRLNAYKGESKDIKLTFVRRVEDTKQEIAERQRRQREENERRRQREQEKENERNTDRVREDDGPVSITTVTPTPEPEPVLKDERAAVMSLDDLWTRRLVELRTEEDVDDFLSSLKQNLINQLDEVDVIKLN
ncbi:BREX system P-loop protein BrxC [Atopococcus tabaci]|uniref:BREX system P-loop protein BrxC n=1 Tax=Atopococcus tabaci TaxID=269774 RepID=UPI000426C814|nr:BREX system P-loop protein BrxC [Atopococcus tabaci]